MTFARLAGLLGGAALLVAACGSPGDGGNTTCDEYRSLDRSTQSDVILDFLASKGNDSPSNIEVVTNRESANLYCSTVGSGSDPISNIDG